MNKELSKCCGAEILDLIGVVSGLYCRKCSKLIKRKPQPPTPEVSNDWSEEFDKLEVTYDYKLGRKEFTEPLMLDDEQEKAIKQFISKTLADERVQVRKKVVEEFRAVVRSDDDARDTLEEIIELL